MFFNLYIKSFSSLYMFFNLRRLFLLFFLNKCIPILFLFFKRCIIYNSSIFIIFILLLLFLIIIIICLYLISILCLLLFISFRLIPSIWNFFQRCIINYTISIIYIILLNWSIIIIIFIRLGFWWYRISIIILIIIQISWLIMLN